MLMLKRYRYDKESIEQEFEQVNNYDYKDYDQYDIYKCV
jgi:hypothetical protein